MVASIRLAATGATALPNPLLGSAINQPAYSPLLPPPVERYSRAVGCRCGRVRHVVETRFERMR
jgi:hypothetical protein